jgi:Cdc6-like AAA superfamily ATPase
MLSGPPGTGKTTTLIRRLAQKRSIDELLEEERSLVPDEQLVEFFYPDNWIMFTPTDLLKLYLKEAFAKEGIAASEDRVRTWADERRRLARDILRVLRSEQGGRFTLDESANTLMDITSTGVMGLSEAFNAFVQGQVADQYQSVLEGLSKDSDAELADLVGRVRRRLGGDHVLFDRVFELVEFHEELREHISRLSTNVEEVQRTAINSLLARKP